VADSADVKAWRVHELGEPIDVLRLEDVEPPTASEGQVLLDVEAVALNFPDVLLCRGQYQEKPPLPFTPGLELCGRDSDGRRWLGGAPLPHGGLAEQVAVARAGLFPVPDDMPAAQAASLMVTYQTGHVGLHRRAQLREGETLLVHAGAGGVGSAAIQLGLAAGARVLATAGGPAKVEVCRSLGAEVVIDYLADDFVAAVKDATDGRGADVIYDSVGGETFTKSTKCIAFEGRIVVIGFAGGVMAQAATNHILIKNYSVVGLHWGLYRAKDPGVIPATHEALLALWADRLIDPLVADELPMAQAAAGIARLAERGTVGKVVVTPGS
jgi:NADPH2:quinone reductase